MDKTDPKRVRQAERQQAAKADRSRTRETAERTRKLMGDRDFLGIDVCAMYARRHKLKPEEVTPEQAEEAWEWYLAVMQSYPTLHDEQVERLRQRERAAETRLKEARAKLEDAMELGAKTRWERDGLLRTIELQARQLGATDQAEVLRLARLQLQGILRLEAEDKPYGFTKGNIFYSPGDEDAPFGSEGFLYPLLGKETARTLRGRFRALAETLGTTLEALLREDDEAET